MTKSKEELIRILKSNIKEFNLYREETNFQPLDLQNIDLTGCNLCRANLINTDLRGAELNYAYLHSANMQNCNLSDLDVGRADLTEANLTSSNLTKTNFSNTILLGTNMSKITGRSIKLENAKLRETNFKDADLSEGNLSNIELTNINFEGTNLKGTNFTNSNLKSVQNIDKSIFDLTTIWPNNNLPKDFDPSLLNKDTSLEHKKTNLEKEISYEVSDVLQYEFTDNIFETESKNGLNLTEEKEESQPVEFTEPEVGKNNVSDQEIFNFSEINYEINEFEELALLEEHSAEPLEEETEYSLEESLEEETEYSLEESLEEETKYSLEESLEEETKYSLEENLEEEILKYSLEENLEEEEILKYSLEENLEEEEILKYSLEENLEEETPKYSQTPSQKITISQDPNIMKMLHNIFNKLEDLEEEQKNQRISIEELKKESLKTSSDDQTIEKEVIDENLLSRIESKVDIIAQTDPLEQIDSLLNDIAYSMHNEQEEIKNKINTLQQLLENANDSLSDTENQPQIDNIVSEIYKMLENLEANIREDQHKSDQKIEDIATIVDNIAILISNGQDSNIPLLTTNDPDNKTNLPSEIKTISEVVQNINTTIEKLQSNQHTDSDIYEAFYNFEFKLQAELETNKEKLEHITTLFSDFSNKIELVKDQISNLDKNVEFNETVDLIKDRISNEIENTEDRSKTFKDSLDLGIMSLKTSVTELKNSFEQETSNINQKLDSVITYINTPSDSNNTDETEEIKRLSVTELKNSFEQETSNINQKLDSVITYINTPTDSNNTDEAEYINKLIEKLQSLQDLNLGEIAKQIPTKDINEKLSSLNTQNNEIIHKTKLLLSNLQNIRQNSKDVEISSKLDIIINNLISKKEINDHKAILNELHNQNTLKVNHQNALKTQLELLLSELQIIKDINISNNLTEKTEAETTKLKDLIINVLHKLDEINRQESNTYINQKLETIDNNLSNLNNLNTELGNSNKHLTLESQQSLEEITKINHTLNSLNSKLINKEPLLEKEIEKIKITINELNKNLSHSEPKFDDELRSIIEHLLIQLNESNKTSKESTVNISQKFEDFEMDLQITLKDMDRRISKINSMIRNIYKSLDNLTDLVTESSLTSTYNKELERADNITA